MNRCFVILAIIVIFGVSGNVYCRFRSAHVRRATAERGARQRLCSQHQRDSQPVDPTEAITASIWGRAIGRSGKFSNYIRRISPPDLEPVAVSIHDLYLTPLAFAGCRVRCHGNVKVTQGGEPYREGELKPLERLSFFDCLDCDRDIGIRFQKGEVPKSDIEDVMVVGVADVTDGFEFGGLGQYGFCEYVDELYISDVCIDHDCGIVTNAPVRAEAYYSSPVPEFKMKLIDRENHVAWYCHYYSGFLKVAQTFRTSETAEEKYKYEKIGIWRDPAREPLFRILRRLNEALPKDVVCGNVSDDGFVRAYPYSEIKCHVISKEKQPEVYAAVENALNGFWDIPMHKVEAAGDE